MPKKRHKKAVIQLIEKARESAIQAVSTYNNPVTLFRSGSYIVLMNIAWTSLFHAVFLRDNIKYYYKDNHDKRKYMRVNGDPKTWDLSRCSVEYFKGSNNATYANIQFFVNLRNKIEHSFLPQLDQHIFGECQSYLMNFEDILVGEFGLKYSLADTLMFALQYSKLRNEQQVVSVKKLQSKLFLQIMRSIDQFRSSLDSQVLSDPKYSFRVFLVPKPANRASSSDLAVEFVKYDSDNPKEMEQYKRIVTIIKEKRVPVGLKELDSGVNKPSIESSKVVLVDRGKLDVGSDAIGITDDPSKASGVLVVEELSSNIFDDVKKIVDAGVILQKRLDEFPFSKRTLMLIYSGRNRIMSCDKAAYLLEASYEAYCPYYNWLVKVDNDIVRSLLTNKIQERKHPNIYSIIRMLISTKSKYWNNQMMKAVEHYKDHRQKPEWCWYYKKSLERLQSKKPIYAAIEMSENSEIFGITLEELLKNNRMASNLLTEKCKESAEDDSVEKSQIRALDLVVHFRMLSKTLEQIA